MSHFKRSQRKYVKKTYRVRNWHEYEAGLRERGSLTVCISLNDGKLANWDAPNKPDSANESGTQNQATLNGVKLRPRFTATRSS